MSKRPKKRNLDELAIEQFNELIESLCKQSLAVGQTKEAWASTLRALREELEVHIEATRS